MSRMWPFEFEIDALSNCVVVTWVGDVDLETLVVSQRQILSDSRFKAGMDFLIDGREATLVGVDYGAIRAKILPVVREFAPQRGGSRSAIVVSSTKDFGIVRQLGSVLAEAPCDVDRRPFYEIVDACAWLGISVDTLTRLTEGSAPGSSAAPDADA